MEVTFDISDDIMERLLLEASRCGKPMSAVVESALRISLPNAEPPREADRVPLPPLPTWKAEMLIDVSNREELYRVLDDAEDSPLRRLYGHRPGLALYNGLAGLAGFSEWKALGAGNSHPWKI